jgi:aminoglycoside phosphotransferase (APT) family kinase protein
MPTCSGTFVADPPPRGVEPETARLIERLTRAAQAWVPGARATSVRRLAQGASSLTYVARIDDAPAPTVVVKVAPTGLPPTRHRDVLRQARLLQGLATRADVPAPDVLFTDPGDDEVGCFFAMSYCDGEAFEPSVDDVPGIPPTAEQIGRRASEAARILARLHSPDAMPDWIHQEPPISLAQEVDRWDRALATLPHEFGLDWQPQSRHLRATMPASAPPRLTHGDYRLGNLICAGSRVVAVVDWEIWSRSDRRLDLGWFLLNLDPASPAAVRAVPGLPTRDQALAVYTGAGGSPLHETEWFLAVALYKFAATTGLIAKNALKRGETDSWGARMITRLPLVLDRVDELLDSV